MIEGHIFEAERGYMKSKAKVENFREMAKTQRRAVEQVDILGTFTNEPSKLHLKKNPTLGDIQAYIMDLEEERDLTKQSLLELWVLVSEEIGGLAKCIRKAATSTGTGVAKHYNFNAADKLADLLIVLSATANRLGVDLEQAFRDKEEVNKKRKWA